VLTGSVINIAVVDEDDPKTGGYGVVQISDWGDQPVAWAV